MRVNRRRSESAVEGLGDFEERVGVFIVVVECRDSRGGCFEDGKEVVCGL